MISSLLHQFQSWSAATKRIMEKCIILQTSSYPSVPIFCNKILKPPRANEGTDFKQNENTNTIFYLCQNLVNVAAYFTAQRLVLRRSQLIKQIITKNAEFRGFFFATVILLFYITYKQQLIWMVQTYYHIKTQHNTKLTGFKMQEKRTQIRYTFT